MLAKKKSRCASKENRIPLGKKKETLEKSLRQNDTSVAQILSDKQTSKTKTKANNPLKTININVVSTDTSLLKPIMEPKPKLSTIKEIKEIEDNENKNVKTNNIKTLVNDSTVLIENKGNLKTESTKVVINEQEANNIDDFKDGQLIPEIVLSPYVCTTRGKKWKPTPVKPPKLSELFDKYEDDSVADAYRKKLDDKTTELQNKIKYWTELSVESGSGLPESVKDEVDVVCGQAKLLTTDKFMQMRRLIEEFDNKSGAMPITTTDLDGFWDMLLLQVEKLEGQFSQLRILKENNWISIQPIAKKVINKVFKVYKRPEVKSKFADFIKTQKLKEKTKSPANDNSDQINMPKKSKFNEMKLDNNTCLISSTPAKASPRNVSFTPVLLKTMELSYVARRSGMTPDVVAEPHESPLKPALKNPKQTKGTKRKTIQFKSLEAKTPENSCNGTTCTMKRTQNRVLTPHVVKKSKVTIKKADTVTQNKPTNSTNSGMNAGKLKSNVKAIVKKTTVVDKLVESSDNNGTMRRSSRLASKPLKNYKC